MTQPNISHDPEICLQIWLRTPQRPVKGGEYSCLQHLESTKDEKLCSIRKEHSVSRFWIMRELSLLGSNKEELFFIASDTRLNMNFTEFLLLLSFITESNQCRLNLDFSGSQWTASCKNYSINSISPGLATDKIWTAGV